MKKLFKFLLWLLAIIVIFVVVLYLTAEFWIKSAVSNIIPQMTKTPVSLQEADISLFSGRIALIGFKIGNPEGFKKQNAFELQEISVKFEPKSLLSSKLVINEIKLDGTKINAEMARSGNVNIVILNNNVQGYLGKNSSENLPVTEGKVVQNKDTQKTGKEVVVKDLKIINSSVDFTFMDNTTLIKLPNIREKNIGEKTKETLPDVIARVFTDLTTSAFQAISKAGQKSVNKLLDNLAGRSKEASNFVKGLKAEMNSFF